MNKTAAVVIFLLSIKVTPVYGQYRVNDIKNYNGWYKINVESDSNGNARYAVTQCYPNGDEYRLSDNERRDVPLWVKVFCLAMFEEVLMEEMDSMSFSADGIYMRMMGFTLMIDYSQSDEEVLESFEPEVIAKYKNRNW
jgi:hypothetical protein